jgi:hypothetical protein
LGKNNYINLAVTVIEDEGLKRPHVDSIRALNGTQQFCRYIAWVPEIWEKRLGISAVRAESSYNTNEPL